MSEEQMYKLLNNALISNDFIPNINSELSFLQEWRQNVVGKISGDRIQLMNVLDEGLHKNTCFKERWTLCDMFAMAVALDHNCVTKSMAFKVK